MKIQVKLKYLIVLIILLSSCNLTGEIYQYDWRVPVKIETTQEALNYVKTYTYQPKYGTFLPDEFYDKGYGDCEDFALMFQFILETELNIKADLVGGYYNGSKTLHMWVESDNNIYEPILGIINYRSDLYKETCRYEYPSSIYMVRRYGGFLK